MSRSHTIVLTSALIVAAGGCSIIVQTGPQCESDSDCRLAGYLCRDGLCVDGDNPNDGSVPQVDVAGWVMSYSTAGSSTADASLHLAVSTDGRNWTHLNGAQPVFAFEGLGSNRVGDPHLFRRSDGPFVLLATDLTHLEAPSPDDPETLHIVVANSPDLLSFSEPRLLKVRDADAAESAPRTVVAPHAFYDPERREYGILWSGADSTGRSRIYVTYTADFETVSNAVPIVFFDPGYSVDHARLVAVDDGYRLVFHDASAAGDDVQMARSSSLGPGSFTVSGTTYPTRGLAAGVSTHTRAPFLIGRDDEWFLYAYGNENPPALRCWTAPGPDASPSEWMRFEADTPAATRDGSALGLSRAELDALTEHYGVIPEQRWRTTYAEGDTFYVARSLDQAVLAKAADRSADLSPRSFRWRIVSGLADPNDTELVSFESVSAPGHYLRIDSANPDRYPPIDGAAAQSGALNYAPASARHHIAWVEPQQDTDVFRRDATFRRIPALNGREDHSSFRWLYDETRVLRHAYYHVFATPIDGSPLQNGEASFLFEPQ